MKRLLLATGAVVLLAGGAYAQSTTTRTETQSPAPMSRTTGNTARTEGMTSGGTAMNENQIVQNLEKQGYTNVRVTNRNDKGHVDVMAMKGGRNEKLTVDPATGQAMPDKD